MKLDCRMVKGMGRGISCLLVAALVTVSCVKKSENAQAADKNLLAQQTAPLLEGMGEHRFEVSLQDSLAARYFNQAIILTYGFNHKEAERSFRQVAQLEPDNPMAWWGVALVQGPNINLPMLPEAVPVAWEALHRARELMINGTPRERDYIEALSERYVQHPTEDRFGLDSAYAEVMRVLAEKYPRDLDARALYAEALMDMHPWDFWTKEGEARPWTPKIIEALEYVIERNPDHPLANHLYIHATEASSHPEKALPSARRLGRAVPGAGHLVHMPAHAYIRVGMYHEGTQANERAVLSDDEYIAQCHQQGIYPLGYVPHNHHFLWATASLEGRKDLSLRAAQSTHERVDTVAMRQPGMGLLQHFWTIPLYGKVRFGDWDAILAYPQPAADLRYPTGVWHYARGMAYLGKKQPARAGEELALLKELAADESLKEVVIGNTAYELLQIASLVLEGEIAAADKNYATAENLFRKAIQIEYSLRYNEPPDWFFPVRHNLGAVLLEAGRAEEAEQVYREDLNEFPSNGWALFGLHQSLMAQQKAEAAAEVKERFDKAWQYSDIQLTSSRIL